MEASAWGVITSAEPTPSHVFRIGLLSSLASAALLLLASCGDAPTSSPSSIASSIAAPSSLAPTTIADEPTPTAPVPTAFVATPSSTALPGDTLLREIEAKLPARSYLEERCTPGEPLEGVPTKHCTYRRMGREVSVTLADIPRASLARWILQASEADERTAGDPNKLRTSALTLTEFVVAQSSGAIPLEGDVWEDMAGDGAGALYRFDRGVSEHSGTCRPMSLTQTGWCATQSDSGSCEHTDFHQVCIGFVRDALASGRHAGLTARARLLAHL